MKPLNMWTGKCGSAMQTMPDVTQLIPSLQDACSIDFDPIRGRLYWIDCELSEIRSAAPNGSEV